jgi:hypothetical protein
MSSKKKPKPKSDEPKPSRFPLQLKVLFSAFAVLVGLVVSWLSLLGSGPTLYESNPVVRGESFTVTITNKGRTAQVGKVWCAAGAYLTPGSGKITKIIDSSPDIFRRSSFAPDEQEQLQMLVPASINPEAASRLNNLLWLQLHPFTTWGVACRLPYWDGLDKWKLHERDLKFCYQVQPSGVGSERSASMCTLKELVGTIHELGGPG